MNSPFEGTFRVSQIYKGDQHKGIDLVGVDHKEVRSTVTGVVEAARWDLRASAVAVDPDYGMGQYVRIKDDVTQYHYYFAHLNVILVRAGQRVNKGDIIGIEGSTGNATGTRVHYEIRETTSNTTHLDVNRISGIPNELGTYCSDNFRIDQELLEYRKIVQEKAGLEEKTMDYLEGYRYGKDLLRKLSVAMTNCM